MWPMPISLEKIEAQAPELLSLVKEARSRLSAQALDTARAKVALCVDHSGSMRALYVKGVVQRIAERALALATQFDDDGAIDVFIFDTGAVHAGELTLADYAGGIDRLRTGRRMGRTDYAAAMTLVREHFPADGLPVYVLFVTDGAPDSRTAARQELVTASQRNIFYKFLGVGEGPFDFLRRLDDLRGRPVDNAHFVEPDDIEALDDRQVFDLLLAEYPQWLDEARKAGLLT
ncbi:TerF vWA domain-containing protein [Parafrankia irregularis]|uniref:TerF vWA domain-containing protein n=2 Tax=Frankiaceae TaxID=74712 RepID=A0A0S4QXD1_9ACTN|nr:TerF vWA domain-containing protein [Parafrankia irregularis]